MRLPFLRSKAAAPEPRRPRGGGAAAAQEDTALEAARTQARRRLIGALVLLAVGVIGFPLLFETQPRPLPPDTPILVSAELLGSRPPATSSAPPRPLPVPPADAGVEPVAAASAASAASVSPVAAVPAASAAPTASMPRTGTSGARPAASAAAAATAATAPTPAAGRWVVQVGAYNDAERLKAARARLQKLGLASYTQEVDSSTGRRTRVRVGPFKTRAEADAVAGRVKSAGLQAAVLSL